MNQFTAFLKLIRVNNLLIIAFTQYAMRWGIIYPFLEYMNYVLHHNYPDKITNPHIMKLQLGEWQFFFLSLSTVLIAAAGYIINDYFDTRIDRINKPGAVIIDQHIKRRVAMAAHVVINALGIIIAAALAYSLGITKMCVIHILCAGGLWFYSTTLKRELLIGNILIALFTAFVPLVVAVYEIPLLKVKYELMVEMFEVSFKQIFYFISAFAFFAFMTTLIREITKDVEDMEGDQQFGRSTIPVAWGIPAARWIIVLLSVIIMGVLGYVQWMQYQGKDWLSLGYIGIFVQLPLLFFIVKTFLAKVPKNFSFNHKWIKLVMLFGVMYVGVIYYLFVIKNG